jgi:hypothetical protein
MTQRQLNRAVARATGEQLSTIRGMGFSPLAPLPDEFEREPLVVDWDQPDSPRPGYFPSCGSVQHTAA